MSTVEHLKCHIDDIQNILLSWYCCWLSNTRFVLSPVLTPCFAVSSRICFFLFIRVFNLAETTTQLKVDQYPNVECAEKEMFEKLRAQSVWRRRPEVYSFVFDASVFEASFDHLNDVCLLRKVQLFFGVSYLLTNVGESLVSILLAPSPQPPHLCGCELNRYCHRSCLNSVKIMKN